MSKEVERKHYNKSTIIMLTFCGSIFFALAIGVLVNIIRSLFRTEVRVATGWFVIVPILLFVVLPMVFASIAYYNAGKEIYHWYRENKTKKQGYDTTAKIIDYKVVCYKNTVNKRYALTLSYKDNGEIKTFTTNYIFDINEFRYLKSLDEIKIRVNGDFATVVEPFTEDIYKLDSKYEIENDFYRQKKVFITLKIWRWTSIPAVIFLFVSIVLTCVFNKGIYFMIGAILLVGVNIPIMIAMAIFLIKWIWGNDRKKFEQNKYNGLSKYKWKKQNKNSQND